MNRENIAGSDLENKVKYDDIQLIYNGTKTTLKSEINHKIQSYQKRDSVDYLQHDIMIIDQANKNDDMKNVVERAFRSSNINWNLLFFEGQKFLDEKPEIMRIVKPNKIIATAKKTGIVERKLWSGLIGSGLILLFCLLLCGALLFYTGGNLKGSSNIAMITEILQSKAFLISWCVSGFAGLLIYRFIKENRLVNDTTLLKKILANTGMGNSCEKTSSEFFSKIRDEILKMQMPIAIVVGGNEFLDSFTRRILNELLTIERHQSNGLIFWVIVDQEKPDSENELISLIKKNSSIAGYSYHNYRFEGYL